jgi:hypothetical protein
MLRNIHIAATFCFLAVSASLCMFATSSVAAKHRSVTSTGKHRSGTPTTKQKPDIPTDRTPTNTNDCLAMSQALYGQAETLSRRTKQIIPRELARVASNLDESCGEEDFEKARISIDWMNTCLKNFTKDYKLGFCSRTRSYFCAIDPQSDGCLQSQ